jgi:gas vesicle protein
MIHDVNVMKGDTMGAMDTSTDKSAYMTLGFMFGIIGGVAAGMLLAPKSGRESREQIKLKAQETQARLKQQAAIQKASVTEKVNRARNKAQDVADQAKDTAGRARDAAKETLQEEQ